MNEITIMNTKVLAKVGQSTPSKHIKTRQGKGGKYFKYVSTSYVQKRLNDAFNWYWSFEVKESGNSPDNKQIWVLGKLTVLNPQTMLPAIIKEQFGRKDIAMLKSGGGAVDYGNDLKAAASDSLKKCASLLGICADIYADDDTASEIASEVDEVMMSALEKDIEKIKLIEDEQELRAYCTGIKKVMGKEFAKYIIPVYQERLKVIREKGEKK